MTRSKEAHERAGVRWTTQLEQVRGASLVEGQSVIEPLDVRPGEGTERDSGEIDRQTVRRQAVKQTGREREVVSLTV